MTTRVPPAPFTTGRALRLLDRYDGFGIKRSGGTGDTAAGDWVASELADYGYDVQRQAVAVPWLETSRCELVLPDRTAVPLWLQAPGAKAGEGGPSGFDDRLGTEGGGAGLTLLHLPHRRWSYYGEAGIGTRVAEAFAAGARGVILVTDGPSGEAVALNRSAHETAPPGPVLVLAPRHADRVMAAARSGAMVRLELEFVAGERQACNLSGRIVRAGRPGLVLSTPRSGWFDCSGERGPGVAAFLMLADWASQAIDADLTVVCTSGHEQGHRGATAFLREWAPPVASTALWLHLGANLATLDHHEVGDRLVPLPSADPQRFLVATPQFLPMADAAFVGLAGLEQAYSAEQGAAGELADILAAGYRAAGVFGTHRFHHTVRDLADCVSPDQVAVTARALADFILAVLQAPAEIAP